MDEFEFIREMLAPLSIGAPGARGLGDDAATIVPRAGHELVVTADTVIGGVHFREEDAPGLVARKALRVNLSDLAAKGAVPIGFLMCLSIPRGTDKAWLRAFTTDLGDDINVYGLPLLGGDTVSTPGPLTISITALGEVPTGEMLTRSGAKPGDAICVTGTIGDAALGLDFLRNKDSGEATTAGRDHAVDRYLLPQPRLKVGFAIRHLASASLDISDGLVGDIGHVCEQSKVGATIERSQIPLSPTMRKAIQDDDKAWRHVFGGGDDYEIAFTVPPGRIAEIQGIARTTGTPITVIGGVNDGNSVRVVDESGGSVPVLHSGYRHL
ncbi:MAG: thiamine-phosphate kinase [Rhodobacteraceae bacterium]|nr:thiamine-phosphate kinase [Paracoccaceae bacterium]